MEVVHVCLKTNQYRLSTALRPASERARVHYVLLPDHARGLALVYLGHSQPPGLVCRPKQCAGTTSLTSLYLQFPQSLEISEQLLRLKVRKHEPQISQNVIMNSVNNIINLKYKSHAACP